MTEIRENSSTLSGVRRKIKKAAKEVGVNVPKKGTQDEEMLVTDFAKDAHHRNDLNLALQKQVDNGGNISGDHLDPIIMSLGSKNSRLREDIAEPSPLTPDQVADILSSRKDKNTGMPIVHRKPGLKPWEGVSHQ